MAQLEDAHDDGMHAHGSHAHGCCCDGCLSDSAGANGSDSAGASTSYVLHGAKWGDSGSLGTTGGTVTWNFAGMGAYYIGQSAYRDLVEQAFDRWEEVANIDFVQVSDDQNANIDVYWDDGTQASQLGTAGGTIGVASWSIRSGGRIPSAEVFFDLADFDENGGLDAALDSVFYQVALHEIGHAIGLGHVNDSSQIMNGVVRKSTPDLGEGDIAGIQALYGPAVGAPPDPPDEPPEPPAPSTPTSGTGSRDVLDHSDKSFAVQLYGYGGNDDLTGGSADDFISGGTGNDNLDGNDGRDVLVDAIGNDNLAGDGGDDIIAAFSGTNTLNGGSGDDLLLGGYNNDTLNGGSDDDVLVGDAFGNLLAGNDVLNGGAGNDLLEGGGGIDRFIFQSGGGNDHIGEIDVNRSSPHSSRIVGTDFEVGVDQIDLSDFNFASFSQVEARLSQSGNDALFTNGADSLRIEGILPDELSSNDFIL